MIHLVTRNLIRVNKLSEYTDNFVICHLKERVIPPMVNSVNWFTVYYQSGMSTSDFEDYTDDNQYKYRYVEVRSISDALDKIISDITSEYNTMRANEDFRNEAPEEIMLACACDVQLNRLVVQYFEKHFSSEHIEVSPLNLHQYLKVATQERLADIVKMSLQSEFVYPEDPISFAYALKRTIDGTDVETSV